MSRLPAPTASKATIRAACEARAAAAALARAEDREMVRCDPIVAHRPPVGGHYPEPSPGPRRGETGWPFWRHWSGIITQGAAFLLLVALAFLD